MHIMSVMVWRFGIPRIGLVRSKSSEYIIYKIRTQVRSCG
jgi:hypothetical protein